MNDTSRSLCYPVYVVIVFHLVKQSAKPLGFFFLLNMPRSPKAKKYFLSGWISDIASYFQHRYLGLPHRILRFFVSVEWQLQVVLEDLDVSYITIIKLADSLVCLLFLLPKSPENLKQVTAL